MFEVLEKEILNPQVTRMVLFAPEIARKALPGQFVILRVNEYGERIPLTIADYERQSGKLTIIFQIVGKTTCVLNELNVGESVLDVVGPLGRPSEIDDLKRACVIGGGLGTAIAYPQAKYLFNRGAHVDVICGFRNKELILLEQELKSASTRQFIVTDDGSNGKKALVTNVLKELLDAGEKYDAVIAIGPLIMMKFVCLTTKEYGIKTIVSMNTTMIDGTGMCGGCRLTVGGETKFACVDGPDFDGHLVDFDESMRRAAMYKAEEQAKYQEHICRLKGVADNA